MSIESVLKEIDPHISLPYYLLAFAFFWIVYEKNGHKLHLSLMTAYLFLVFSSTVFCRTVGQEYRYNLELFWSCRAAAAGECSMVCEIILNCLMLLPVGFLFPTAVKKDLKLVLMTVLAVSVSIELSQLVLKRGLFEFDDILYNAISGALGYGLFLLWEQMRKRICTKGQ